MANMMMCSSRLSDGRWRGGGIPGASNLLKHKLNSWALTVVPLGGPRNLAPLGFTIRAASSDFGDPERISGEGYVSDSQYGYSGSLSGGSDSEAEPFSETSGSFTAKLDAASQLSESVPSSSVEQLEDDGGDRNTGPRGGGGDGGSGNNGGGGDAGSDDEEGRDKKKLSASQKLTLAYALLVGVGGVMGYAKSRSVKSLVSGAVSTAILYYVYKQLPTNPVFASSLGLGISVLLLALMGARFKSSGKLFPAGIVSLVSLIMTGGYIHGIIRSSHR